MRSCHGITDGFLENCVRLGIDTQTIKDKNYADWDDFSTVNGADSLLLQAAQEMARSYENDLHNCYRQHEVKMMREHPIHFPLTQDYALLPKCSHCGTWFFTGEVTSRNKSGEFEIPKLCCKHGSTQNTITMLTPLPIPFKLMLLSNEGNIRSLTRKYNHRFSFSSIGVSYGEFEKQQFPNALRCSGWIYQRIMHAEAHAPLRYYVHDPQYEHDAGFLDTSATSILGNLIRSTNPFAQALQQLGSNPAFEQCTLQVEWNAEAAQASEMASIVYKPTWETPTQRLLVIYRTSDQFEHIFPDLNGNNNDGYFMPMDHPLAEALQYPLLYWGGHKDVGTSTCIEHAWYTSMHIDNI